MRTICSYCGKHISKVRREIREHNFCNIKEFHAYCKEHPEMYKNRGRKTGPYNLIKSLRARAKDGEVPTGKKDL